MMRRASLICILVALLAFSGGQAVASPAADSTDAPDNLSVRDAWVAEPLPGQSMTAAYMVISNGTEVGEELTSVESEVAENLEIHTMEQRGEMMRMRRVDGIEIAAGGEVELKPGGLHIMLIGLTQEVNVGETVELKLIFESGANLVVSAPVKKR